MTKDDIEDNSVDNNKRSSIQSLDDVFDMKNIDDTKLNLNNKFSHVNSNSPQQEKENSPQYVGWKD